MSDPPALFRSLLFVPANDQPKVAKALASGADAVILDLEDAVAESEKSAARARVAPVLRETRHCRCYVRVNSLDTGHALKDVSSVVGPGLDGIVLPKVENAAALATADWLLRQLEQERSLPAGHVDLLPLIETARGIVNLERLTGATSRVHRLAFGAADYTADLGIDWTSGEAELAHARGQLALHSRAAGLEQPIDAPSLEIHDLEQVREAARRARMAGFQGKLCIHPAQVAVCREVFAPTPQELARARRIVAAFADAERRGIAAVTVDGSLVDYAVVARARRTLAAAGESASHSA